MKLTVRKTTILAIITLLTSLVILGAEWGPTTLSAFHKHSGDQILIVTEGTGKVAADGKDIGAAELVGKIVIDSDGTAAGRLTVEFPDGSLWDFEPTSGEVGEVFVNESGAIEFTLVEMIVVVGAEVARVNAKAEPSRSEPGVLNWDFLNWDFVLEGSNVPNRTTIRHANGDLYISDGYGNSR